MVSGGIPPGDCAVQFVVLYHAPGEVAFGAKFPSQAVITCRLYHWEMPSSAESLSATSFAMSFSSSVISSPRSSRPSSIWSQIELSPSVAVG